MLPGSLAGREFGGECIQVCAWLSPFHVHLKLSQHCQLAKLQYKTKSPKKGIYSMISTGNFFKVVYVCVYM